MQTLNIDAFNPKKAELMELAEKSKPALNIQIVDKRTYDQVHSTQMILREQRINIEKTGKSLREDALRFQKDIIAIEKELVAVIEPIEEELRTKKKAYDDEQERIKQEVEAQKQAKITARIQALARYDITYDTLTHGIMSDVTFDALISAKQAEFDEAEKIRLEQIENGRIAREKLEEDQRKFREEQEEVARKNKEAQDKIDAERKAIEDEKNAIEKARVDAENEEKRQKEFAEATERARLQGIEDARILQEKKEMEAKRIEDARIQSEKEEQEKLEKKKKYIEFIKSH